MSRLRVGSLAVLLAGCASMSNTPAQELGLGAYQACRSKALERPALPVVRPDGTFVVSFDPAAPAEPRIFLDCVRPYFAAQAVQDVTQPRPDAPAAQRQGYADLDDCLRRGVGVNNLMGQALGVRPPLIRITALNEDGTFRWEGDEAAGRRLMGCMRQTSAAVQQPTSGVTATPRIGDSIERDAPLEPESLVGEWRGDYVNQGNLHRRDVIVLRIERVDGHDVFGSIEIYGGGGHRVQHVRGTLAGHDLTIGRFELRVDGQRMTGQARMGEDVLDVDLKQLKGGIQPPASGEPTPSGAEGSRDGVYAGDACFGPSPNGDPARCFRAKATVRDGKIVGEWRNKEGVTVTLAGEVSTNGEVRIEWRAARPDGGPVTRANLSGTLRNGHLDASGAFSNGRTVSMSWTLKGPERGSSPTESDGREHAGPSELRRKR